MKTSRSSKANLIDATRDLPFYKILAEVHNLERGHQARYYIRDRDPQLVQDNVRYLQGQGFFTHVSSGFLVIQKKDVLDMIKENKPTYTVSCNCGVNITVGTIRDGTDKKWEIRHSCSSTDPSREFQSVTVVRCPECANKEMQRKYNSADIYDRLSTDYYRDHPGKFEADAIDFVGLKGHPRAGKAFSMAYDRGRSGGYSEVLNALIDYAELMLIN